MSIATYCINNVVASLRPENTLTILTITLIR